MQAAATEVLQGLGSVCLSPSLSHTHLCTGKPLHIDPFLLTYISEITNQLEYTLIHLFVIAEVFQIIRMKSQ